MEEKKIWSVRQSVYQFFTDHQTAPTINNLASILKLSEGEVRANLIELDQHHHALAFSAEEDQITMAWPFSATPTPYPVVTPKGKYLSNCAWDALSIPYLVGQDAGTEYACPDCDQPVIIKFKDGLLEPTEAVVHFSVAPKIFFEDLGCI